MRSIDILRVLLILLGFLVLFCYTYLTKFITNINKNWDQYRCNPVVMPFAGFLDIMLPRILVNVFKINKK